MEAILPHAAIHFYLLFVAKYFSFSYIYFILILNFNQISLCAKIFQL